MLQTCARVASFATLAILVFLSSTMGCALRGGSTQETTLTKVDQGVYLAISGVDDVEWALYKNKVLSVDQHKALNTSILTTLKAGRAANDALAAWPRGTTRPPLAQFNAAADALTALANTVTDFVPDGPARESLKTRIDQAAALIRGVLLGFGG